MPWCLPARFGCMKILHLITGLSTGGAEMMLFNLVSHSMDNPNFRHGVVVLTGQGVFGQKLKQKGIPTYYLYLQGRPSDVIALFRFYRILRHYRPHILQTWLYHSDLIGLLIGKMAGVQSILWSIRCSLVDFDQYAWTTKLIFKLLIRLSHLPDAVIANSFAGTISHRQSGYRCKRWVIIPNGFDTERYKPNKEIRASFRKLLSLGESNFIIGMVARYDPMKDYSNFFNAAGRLSIVFPNVYFVVAGRGMNKTNYDVMKMIQKHGLNNNTFLLGERDDLQEIIPSFDVGTLSSFSEGFPNVLGEYMSCGVPIVSTNVGDSANIIGNTGIIVPPNNPEALAKAWFDLLVMTPEQRVELGMKARQRIVEKFSISKVVEKYENFYFEILTRES